jgi:lysophospholipase L1-like esterase
MGPPQSSTDHGRDSRVPTRRAVHARPRLVVVAALTAALVIAAGVVWRVLDRHEPAGPPPLEKIRSIAVIGDSYSHGTPLGGVGRKGWPALVAEHYGARLTLTAVSGRGYVNPGSRNPGHTFPEQARELVGTWRGDVLIVFGSRNDSSRRFTADVQRRAEDTLGYLVDHLPNTRVVVIGPLWPAQFPPGGDPEGNRTAVQAAALSQPGVSFVDPMTHPWFSAANGTLIGPDNIHPTDAGHRYLSKMVAEVLDRSVLAH